MARIASSLRTRLEAVPVAIVCGRTVACGCACDGPNVRTAHPERLKSDAMYAFYVALCEALRSHPAGVERCSKRHSTP